ncbi:MULTISPECIES: GntR family transcriptional regulator [unclassified Photobacterium]|uniref:GntR family transcriptional regulator n=1 Tax=unclassified Photobacterium TaxID=2628852 RepID=UPI001EDFAA1C|nr:MULTISPECIES: GntR family transcriptional regulator [unclassified Photobacterium]
MRNKLMPVKPTPKQQEVIDHINKKIKALALNVGDKLDTESAIAKTLGLTRTTVREATRHLIEAGKIYRVKGSGLFVSDGIEQQVNQQLKTITPFQQTAHQKQKKESREVLSVAIIQVPNVQIACALHIPPTDKIYFIERLMRFGSMPVSLEQIHIPVSVCEGFQLSQLEQSSYVCFESITGKKIEMREQNISAFNLRDPDIAELLHVDIEQAMIELRETIYSTDNCPVEYIISIINSDLYNIHQITKK